MAITKVIKQPSDLIINTTIKAASLGGNVAPVALLRRGTDTTEDAILVHDIDEMPDLGFGENTEEYALVESMFDVDGFVGPVQIGTFANADVLSLDDLTATPTADGAKVTGMVPGVQKWLEDHIFDGPKWYIPVGMTDDDIKAAADVLYANQRGFLVHQVETIDELSKWHDYAVSTQSLKNHEGHFHAVVEKNVEHKVAAQAVAFASTTVLLDWMRIGNLNRDTFTPDDWTQTERDMIESLNGLTVEDKAGDFMLSGNMELNGDYIDNAFNAQYNTDYIQLKGQKWLNGKKYTTFNDDNINELVATFEAAGDELFQQGTVAAGDDGKADFHVTAVARANVLAYEISKRTYKSVTIKQTLPNAFEKVYIDNQVTL
ncbi:hypothetical protein [Levilactobacillus yonginensis]|uniref:hypothetical protein n=1 Tax=Levilactobacillus yonginensis TaxID=1054041 RepID=UPI00345DB437